MGGLLGLMNGYDWVVGQFPDRKLSDRYSIRRTRSYELPDYLPDDPAAEDTFEMMSRRMLPLVAEALDKGGGHVRDQTYHLPALPAANHAELAPTTQLYEASANNRMRREGGSVTALSLSAGHVGEDSLQAATFADGAEHDFSGREPPSPSDEFWVSAIRSSSRLRTVARCR